MAKQKTMKMKRGLKIEVGGVWINNAKPSAAVKFKITKADKETGNMTVRATCRGELPIYVKIDGESGKAMAGIRGEAPVAARDPSKAFQKAVRQNWVA